MGEKKPGRPRARPIEAGQRVQLSLRVTPAMKARLDAAADASGRSQSQEVELRLEQSFMVDDLRALIRHHLAAKRFGS